MSRHGVHGSVSPLPTPHADLVSARECDFVETLAALHELVGRRVAVYLLGGMFVEGRCTPAAFSGTLTRGYELGRRSDSPVCFEVDEAGSALLAPQTVERLAREVPAHIRRHPLAPGRAQLPRRRQPRGRGARLTVLEFLCVPLSACQTRPSLPIVRPLSGASSHEGSLARPRRRLGFRPALVGRDGPWPETRSDELASSEDIIT